MERFDKAKWNWGNAVTLGQTVLKMVEEGKTKTPEFETMLRVFGREKLLSLYKEAKAKRDQSRRES